MSGRLHLATNLFDFYVFGLLEGLLDILKIARLHSNSRGFFIAAIYRVVNISQRGELKANKDQDYLILNKIGLEI